MLQRVAVCCSVLQCVAVTLVDTLPPVLNSKSNVLACVTVCCSMLVCVAVTLVDTLPPQQQEECECVGVCNSVLQSVAMYWRV